MFYLSFTTPASAPRRKTPASGVPTRTRTAWTWLLLAVWAGLMTFGAVSIADPPWLEELARLGKESEAGSYKAYGDSLLRQNDLRRAAMQYRRSLEIKPDQPVVRSSLGTTYIQLGFAESGARTDLLAAGIECLETALTENPSQRLQSVIHYNLGDVFERQQRPAEALEHYRQAADRGMRADKIYQKMGGILLAQQRFEEAREAFERVLAAQLDPTLSYCEMLARSEDALADLPEESAEIERLKREFRGVDTLAPYDLTLIRLLQQHDHEIAKTHNHLGYIQVRLKQLELAAAHFEKSLEIWPGNQDAVRNLDAVRKMMKKQAIAARNLGGVNWERAIESPRPRSSSPRGREPSSR